MYIMQLSLVFLTIILLSGCTPRYPGIDIAPSPVDWHFSFETTIDKKPHHITTTFDSTGNAYIAYNIIDNLSETDESGLTKVDTNGVVAWNVSDFIPVTPNTQIAKLKIDILGNIFIVYTEHDAIRNITTFFVVKLSENGELIWTNSSAVPSNNGIHLEIATNRVGHLYLLYSTTPVKSFTEDAHILVYDDTGASSEIYQTSHNFTRKRHNTRLTAATDNSLYFLSIDGLQVLHISVTGQILHEIDLIADHPLFEVYISPDDSIYLIEIDQIKKISLTGAVLWAKNILIEGCVADFTINNNNQSLGVRQTILPSDGGVTIMLSTTIAPCAEYHILRFNALGEEFGRIERRGLNTFETRSLTIHYVFHRSVGMFVDAMGNLFVLDTYNSQIEPISFIGTYIFYLNLDQLLQTRQERQLLLTIKYDADGNQTKQALTASDPSKLNFSFWHLKSNLVKVDTEKFSVSADGSISVAGTKTTLVGNINGELFQLSNAL